VVDELVPNRSFDERRHLRIVARVARDGDLGDDISHGLEHFVVGRDDVDREDVALYGSC